MAQKYILEEQIPNLVGGDEPKISNNEIWYTSSDGNVVEPKATDVFGAKIVSNTYSEGKGIIKFYGDVTSIGYDVFSGRTLLTSITIPNSVKSIEEYAFSCCTDLTAITIPDSVTSIAGGSFYGCTGLTAITIPDSVKSIGKYAFADCTGLTSIIVESSNTVYDSRNNCNAIIDTSTNELIAGCQNTIIPDSVTSIAGGAFYGCTGLTSITIPNSVTSIGYGAFNNCDGLTSITIPNSVTSIRNLAFYGNDKLHTIIFDKLRGTHVRDIGDRVFDACPNLKTVIVDSDEDAEIIFKKISQNNITFDIWTFVNIDENGVIVKDI